MHRDQYAGADALEFLEDDVAMDGDGNLYHVGAQLPFTAIKAAPAMQLRPKRVPQMQLRPSARITPADQSDEIRAMKAQIRQLMNAAAQGGLSTEEDPQIPLGVDSGSTLIAAGASSAIQVQSTVPMRLTDFFIPKSIAPDFVISGIAHSRGTLFASGDPVPGEFFVATNTQRSAIRVGEIGANTVVTVTVTNVASSDRRFRATFQGYDLSPPCG